MCYWWPCMNSFKCDFQNKSFQKIASYGSKVQFWIHTTTKGLPLIWEIRYKSAKYGLMASDEVTRDGGCIGLIKNMEQLLRILTPEHLSFEARLGNKSKRPQLCFAASAIRHHLFSMPQLLKRPCWYSSPHLRKDWTSITDNCSKLLWSWREARSPSTDHTGGQFILPVVLCKFSKTATNSFLLLFALSGLSPSPLPLA